MVWDPGAYPNTRKNTWPWIKIGYSGTRCLDHGDPRCSLWRQGSELQASLTRAAAGPRRERGAPNDPRLRWIRRWWCPDPTAPQGPGPPGLLGGHWTHHLIDYSWVIQVGLNIDRPPKNKVIKDGLLGNHPAIVWRFWDFLAMFDDTSTRVNMDYKTRVNMDYKPRCWFLKELHWVPLYIYIIIYIYTHVHR